MPCEPARRPREPEPGLRGTVLIVEDEVLIRFALADFLRSNHFKVYEAHDGEEAIQLLSFYKADIDVVFADVRLPGAINGFALAQWLERYKPETAVMLGSGYSLDANGATNAAMPYFTKPYDLKSIRQAMEAALRERRPRA